MTIHAGTIESGGRALVPESGLVIVAKSAGMTSHDVVARIRRLAGTKRVGHAGTLDPMATGVLVVGIERATRLLGHLALTEKAYTATIRLGQSTLTDDAEGEVQPRADGAVAASDVSPEALRAALVGLTGEIEQVPPKVSAIKVKGQRAYRLTRAGAAPELRARTVTVWRLDLLAVRPAGELLDVDVDVTCSSGTYIRAIARDLGVALGTGGHLTALRRTKVGPYTIEAARTLEQLAEHFEYIPLAQAAAETFPSLQLDDRETWLLSHGVRLAAPWRASAGREPVALGSEGTMAHSTDPNLAGRTPIAAFGPDGSLVALVAEQAGELHPLAVFVP
jgi:tRNA pseudouridine55 synthase